jgi:hypothetical protein
MGRMGRDHAAEFLKYLEWYEKSKRANNPFRVTRFALEALAEIHLMMPGRNDRAEAVRIMHEIVGDRVSNGGGEEKTGEFYDQLLKDANLGPARVNLSE